MFANDPLESLPRLMAVAFGSLALIALIVGAVRFRRWVHKRGRLN